MGLKSYCCEIKFQLCGRSCRTKDVGPGRIAFGGPAESSFCYFYTSLPWNLLCWPFVSDLGHRTAKTQASVKIKLVSTYSLSLFFHIWPGSHLFFPMWVDGYACTIVIMFGQGKNKWKAVTELENHLFSVQQQFQNFMPHKGQIF